VTATITITHRRADGTLVDGTARGDGSAPALKAHRFRWSRDLDLWYQPRSRDRAADRFTIDRLAAALRAVGFTVEVTIDDTASRPFAEAEAERVEHAAARAERDHGRAARAAASRDAHHQAADNAIAGIPPGQPVLRGHHSAPRHLAALDRHDRNMHAAIADGKRSAYWQQRAEAADGYQRHREDPATTRRRIERLEAQRRRIQRQLDATQEPAGTGTFGEDGRSEPGPAPAEGVYRSRLVADAAQLDDELAYWRELLARAEADGSKVWGPDDFQVGDFAGRSGQWHRVLKVNKKSLTVPSIVGGSWNDLLPYSKVTERRRPAADASPPDAEPGSH